jgi:hypothetical protein
MELCKFAFLLRISYLLMFEQDRGQKFEVQKLRKLGSDGFSS